MITIAQITDTLSIGGAEKWLCTLCVKTDPYKFIHKVLATKQGGPLEEYLKKNGIYYKVLFQPRRSIILFPLFIYDVIKTFFGVYRFLKKCMPNIIHCHLLNSGYFGIICGFLLHIPVIYTIHSSNVLLLPVEEKRRFRDFLRKKTAFFLLNRVDALVAVSEAIKQEVSRLFPALRPSVKVIPNGIDTGAYKCAKRGKLRKELNLDPDCILLTNVGNLIPVKNQIMLLKVISSLRLQYSNFKVLIVGEGPLRESLLHMAETLQIKEYVFFLGRRDDIPEILSDTDIFVSTSKWEGLPLSILEAMAAEKPIVATNVPGIKEVLEEGAGILVDLDDVNGFKEAILELIKNPEKRKRLALLAKKVVDKKYSLKESIRKWEALYIELSREKS